MNCRYDTTDPGPTRNRMEQDRLRLFRTRSRLLSLLIVVAGLTIGGCTSGDREAADDGQTPQALEDTELGADGVIVVDDCSTGDDADQLCVGVASGMATAADVGIQSAVIDAAIKWGDDHDGTVVDLSSDNEEDFRNNIDILVDRGYDVVVVPARSGTSILSEAVAAYPETYFVGVDLVGLSEAENLGLLSFSDHEVGFLAGALAGLLTESGDVAQILGSALVPPVSDLRDGFANGVRYTNSRTDVDAFFHPGDLDTAFADPAWGAATAAQALDAGADVLFATGGETGHGALVETASSGDSVFCIGVDFDKWDVISDAQPCLVNSIVKLVGDGLEEMLDAVADGEPKSGEVLGMVGYSDYHDFDKDVPGEIREAAEEIAEQVRAGDVSATRER